MKKYLTLLTLLCTMSISAQSHLTQKLEEFLQTVQQKSAPDKRTALLECSVLVKESSVVIEGETTEANAIKEINDYIVNENLPVTNKINLLPGTEISKKYAIVTVSVANLRKMPEHAAEMVSQTLMGAVLRVYNKQGGWALIKTPDEYLGWVEDDGFVTVNAADVNTYLKAKKIIITGLHPYCFAEPSDKSATVCDLTAAAILELTGTSGAWFKVSLPDGRSGFVKKKEAALMHEYFHKLHVTQEGIIATARTFLGTPYLWGGTSAKGVDCSGFTKSVYFLNGIILSRDASQQVLQGNLVDTVINVNLMQPGDLTFYGKRNSPKGERATHVGIYMGNNEFIHSSGRVRINSFSEQSPIYSEYRTKMFLRAKRILGGEHIQKVIDSPFYFPVQELP